MVKNISKIYKKITFSLKKNNFCIMNKIKHNKTNQTQ